MGTIFTVKAATMTKEGEGAKGEEDTERTWVEKGLRAMTFQAMNLDRYGKNYRLYNHSDGEVEAS